MKLLQNAVGVCLFVLHQGFYRVPVSHRAREEFYGIETLAVVVPIHQKQSCNPKKKKKLRFMTIQRIKDFKKVLLILDEEEFFLNLKF